MWMCSISYFEKYVVTLEIYLFLCDWIKFANKYWCYIIYRTLKILLKIKTCTEWCYLSFDYYWNGLIYIFFFNLNRRSWKPSCNSSKKSTRARNESLLSAVRISLLKWKRWGYPQIIHQAAGQHCVALHKCLYHAISVRIDTPSTTVRKGIPVLLDKCMCNHFLPSIMICSPYLQ